MGWVLHGGIWVCNDRAHTERADAAEKRVDDLALRVAMLEEEIDDMRLVDSTERLSVGMLPKNGRQRFG